MMGKRLHNRPKICKNLKIVYIQMVNIKFCMSNMFLFKYIGVYIYLYVHMHVYMYVYMRSSEECYAQKCA